MKPYADSVAPVTPIPDSNCIGEFNSTTHESKTASHNFRIRKGSVLQASAMNEADIS